MRPDLAISTPPGTYARMAPRSGMSLKNSIDIAAGVIDHDYRGSLGIILVNNSSVPFSVKVHDRVAQLIVERVCMSNVVELQSLPPTERSGPGFGSTGVGAHPCRSGDRQCCSHQGGCCYASVVRALTTDKHGPQQDVSLPGDEAPLEVSIPTCVMLYLGMTRILSPRVCLTLSQKLAMSSLFLILLREAGGTTGITTRTLLTASTLNTIL